MTENYQFQTDRQLLLLLIELALETGCQLQSLTRLHYQLARQVQRLLPTITSITITEPNGDVTMLGTQPVTLAPVTLTLKNASQTTNGSATFPITITNSDGTAPTISQGDGTVLTATVTGPNPDGSYTGTVTGVSVSASAIPVNISADGVVDTVIPFNIVAAPQEVASVDPSKIVVNSPS